MATDFQDVSAAHCTFIFATFILAAA